MSQNRDAVEPTPEVAERRQKGHERRMKEIAEIELPDRDVTYHHEKFHSDETMYADYDPQTRSRFYAHSSLDPNFYFHHTFPLVRRGLTRSLWIAAMPLAVPAVLPHEKRHDSITALPQFPDSSDRNEEARPTEDYQGARKNN